MKAIEGFSIGQTQQIRRSAIVLVPTVDLDLVIEGLGRAAAHNPELLDELCELEDDVRRIQRRLHRMADGVLRGPPTQLIS